MDATLKLSETVIDAVIEKLRNGLAGRIATLNAEFEDTLTVQAPGDTDFYAFGLPGGQFSAIPAIVVTELPAGDYEAESAGSFVWVGDIAVVVFEQDADRGRLGRKLLRQCRAVTEVIWGDPPAMSLTGSAFHIRPVRHVPGPVFEPENETSMWRAMRIVVFRARQFEG